MIVPTDDPAPSVKPEPSEPTDAGGFLTEEQLADPTRFHFDERVVTLPELGGGKLLLRGISVAARTELTRDLPDDPSRWGNKDTAMSLAAYVAKPKMPMDKWLPRVTKWPSKALDRINRELAKLINVEPEEEAALAQEFPDA